MQVATKLKMVPPEGTKSPYPRAGGSRTMESMQESELIQELRKSLASARSEEECDALETRIGELNPEEVSTLTRLSLEADLLEARGGRSPRAATARVRAHQKVLLQAEGALWVRHYKELFKALVRVAELEGTIPELDPSIEGASLLEAAAKAHRLWRQGGSAQDAETAYGKAIEEGAPAPLVPYLLFWKAHLQSVSKDESGALESYLKLQELGPPGKGGAADVARRIRLLQVSLREKKITGLREELATFRENDDLAGGVSRITEVLSQEEEAATRVELQKLKALLLTEKGDLAEAIQQWEEVADVEPSEARVPLRSLRSRLKRESPSDSQPDSEPVEAPFDAFEEADSEAQEAPPQPEQEPIREEEPPKAREPRDLALAEEEATHEIDLGDDRARHQEDLAKRLDAAGQVREAILAYRNAYLSTPPGRDQSRLRRRVAAMAWHQLQDPVLAAEALAGLSHDARQAPDVRRLEEALHDGVVERFRQDVKLGLRTEAFSAVADLFRNLDVSEPLRKELFQLHLDELSSCVYRRLRLRRQQVEEELQGFRSRGLGGELVRLPHEAEGSPRHLAELEEELNILDAMLKTTKAREWAVLRLGDVVGQTRRLEDREGIRSMEAILGFVREVAQRRVQHGHKKPLSGWRDRIASMLPDSAKEIFLSEGGRSINVAQADLLGQFEAFLDLKYSSRRR